MKKNEQVWETNDSRFIPIGIEILHSSLICTFAWQFNEEDSFFVLGHPYSNHGYCLIHIKYMIHTLMR